MDLIIKEFDGYYEIYENGELVYKTRDYYFILFTYKIIVLDSKNNWKSIIKNKLRFYLIRQIEIKSCNKNAIIPIYQKNIFSKIYSFSINENSYTVNKLNKHLFEVNRNEIRIATYEYGFNEYHHYGFYKLTINDDNNIEDLLFYFNIFVAIIGRFYTD